ncbi:MAG: hypothetical protein LC624_03180 [Halobacteriales archaeon]|nr:hypothetical protein [Halobacteriales archaeon]
MGTRTGHNVLAPASVCTAGNGMAVRWFVAVGLVGVLALAALVPVTASGPEPDSHVKRIVWPYGADERWFPVVAGYQVLPPPAYCDFNGPAGDVLFQDSFERTTLAPWALADPVVTHTARNEWHVTPVPGYGSDGLHQGAGKLYFGNDDTSLYRNGSFRVAGTVQVPITLPAGPTPWFASLHTKWAAEGLIGYDHMWIEAQPADGRVYILCTMNPQDRPDSASTDTESGTCSPYHTGPCLADTRCYAGTLVTPNALCPVAPYLSQVGKAVDPTAPHWESRSVMIPPIWNGQTVLLRLTFDSADGTANRFLGWMADDVTVSSAVVPSLTLPGGTVVGG